MYVCVYVQAISLQYVSHLATQDQRSSSNLRVSVEKQISLLPVLFLLQETLRYSLNTVWTEAIATYRFRKFAQCENLPAINALCQPAISRSLTELSLIIESSVIC